MGFFLGWWYFVIDHSEVCMALNTLKIVECTLQMGEFLLNINFISILSLLLRHKGYFFSGYACNLFFRFLYGIRKSFTNHTAMSPALGPLFSVWILQAFFSSSNQDHCNDQTISECCGV